MSQRAALNTTDIRGALERAISLTRHVTVRQAWYELGWRWPALVAGLLLVDLVGSGPAWFRWIGLVAMAGYPAIAILNIRERLAKRSYPEEHAARLVEQGHPELNNALINAVQFQRVVEGVSAAQAGLMRREISRAENAVATTSIDGVVDRAGERRARILLFGVIGAWLAGAAIFPGVVGAILPRLFAPWMDDVTPPFSLTKLDISPKGASVRYGGALVVSVALQGPVPESLSLATRSAKGTWSDVPLESTEPGKYAVTLSALRDDTWIVAHAGTPAAWGGGARSGRYLIKVVQPPTAEALQATYSYPAYTGQKELTEQVGEPGIHGLRDTKVRLQITANREVTGGEVVLESKDAPDQHFGIQISDRNARIAVAAFPITASGTFRVALASGDEQVNSDAAQGKVVLERDQRPNVWFNEPPSEIVVTPDMKVGLEIEADDDIGVARIDLHRVINGIADNAAAVYRGQPVKRIGNRLVMDMADLGVRPGDEITYYADAFDNDPGHPNYAETDPYKIRVSSPEAYKKLLKDQRDVEKLSQEASDMQSALNSLAERQQDLADKMEKFAKELAKRPGDPGLKQQTAAAQQEQKKLQAEAQQMAKRLEEYAKSPSGSAIESALKKKIGEAAQGVANAANQAMKAAASGDPAAAAQGARQAASALGKTAGAAQKSVGEAIKNIEKVAPLFADVEVFKSLLDRQGQLVLQAREFEQSAPSDDAARAKLEAISADQQQIRDELKALQDDLRRHAADAQKDFPRAAATAVKIADEIGRRQIPDLMGAAHDGFSRGQGQEGFGNARKALEQMEAMMSQGGACQGACKGELDLSLSRSLGGSGLGQSLGSCMNPGAGTQPGSGMGSGAGGKMSSGSGESGARMSASGPTPYTMNLKGLAGESSSKKSHAQNQMANAAADLSADRIERLDNGEKSPPKASDSAIRGYPPEYRKLIKDYFICVTQEKRTGAKP